MSERIIPFPVESFTLGNGLKTVVVPMPSNGLLSFWSIVRTGSRDEFEAGRTGFAHFFEHMMARGTKRYSTDEYLRILLELGANANAFTTDDLTVYHMAIPSSGLERAFEIESDRFLNLDYPESEFRTEAGSVYGEYRKCKTDPEFVLYEAVRETAFEQHTYGHTTMGYEADIAAMPGLYDFSRGFFSRYYRPENTILLVCGDAEPSDVESLVRKYYDGWQRGYVAPEIPLEPEQTAEKRVEAAYPGETLPLVWLAWKIGRADPDDRLRAACDLLVDLTWGETSQVYRRLVLQEQSIELLTSYVNSNRDPSLLDVYARVKDAGQVEPVLAALGEAALRATEDLVTDEQLEMLKSRKRYEFLMRLETTESVAGSFARPLAIDGALDGIERLHASYAGLTPADIREAAREILKPARRTTGILRAAGRS